MDRNEGAAMDERRWTRIVWRLAETSGLQSDGGATLALWIRVGANVGFY